MDKLLDELDLGQPQQRRLDTLERTPPVRLNGALPKELFVEYERDLTVADIEALSLPRGVKPRSLVRIHASHHSLAKCIASGMRDQHAALITGYSPGRIGQLRQDQAFSALVEDYRAESKSIMADMTERMSDLSLDALEMLQERLHDNPETFSVGMLLDMVKAFADRTGHGPGQEVYLKVQPELVDRPPRETYEQWKDRRNLELTGEKENLN